MKVARLIFLTLTAAMLIAAVAPGSATAGPLVGVSASVTPAFSGFSQPVYITGSGDGSGRLWVLERPGRIKLISGGHSHLYYNATSRVRSTGGEQGLLGIAFSPKFRSNGRFYISYTRSDGALVVQRLKADRPASPAPRISVLSTVIAVAHPTYANHNGGCMQFGRDGYLYIGTGDGGGAGNKSGSAQSRSSRLGKILRIDVGESPYTARLGIPRTYRVPDSNPYKGKAGWAPEIWSRGLRNPWRWSFDRATGDLWIGDVGQDTWEEVDSLPAPNPGRGSNFGWRLYEGNAPYNPKSPPASTAGLTFPVWTYGHPDGTPPDANGGEAIIGGYVYRGTTYPALSGVYLYADWANGRIWGLRPASGGGVDQSLLCTTRRGLSAIGQADSGQLYITNVLTGVVSRIVSP